MKKKSGEALVLLCIGIAALVLVVTRRNSQNTAGTMQSLTGTVTAKFTDCVGGEVMDMAGRISSIKNVSCDGGSTIAINHTKAFLTETGMVPRDQAFSVDVSDIKVGDKVTTKYLMTASGSATLNCAACSIKKDN